MIKEDLKHIHNDFFAEDFTLLYQGEAVILQGILDKREVEEEKVGGLISPKTEIVATFLLSELQKKIADFDYKKVEKITVANQDYQVDDSNVETGHTNALGEFLIGLKNA